MSRQGQRRLTDATARLTSRILRQVLVDALNLVQILSLDVIMQSDKTISRSEQSTANNEGVDTNHCGVSVSTIGS